LIVGEQSPQSPNTGNIRVYLNQGTNSSPVFGNYTIVYAGSNQLYKFRANPAVYDLDMDGLQDLIVGNDDGRVYFFKNVGTNAAPVFNSTYDTLRTQNGLPIDVDNGSRIHFVDWTGDGDLDLLVGGYSGNVKVYENATLTGIKENEQQIPTIREIHIAPNPVTHAARLSYCLEMPAHVIIETYTVDGRLVNVLSYLCAGQGQHEVIWPARDAQGRVLPAGVYLVRFRADGKTKTASIVVTR
jgi:hypothetical protein